jgi:hypothetical protein
MEKLRPRWSLQNFLGVSNPFAPRQLGSSIAGGTTVAQDFSRTIDDVAGPRCQSRMQSLSATMRSNRCCAILTGIKATSAAALHHRTRCLLRLIMKLGPLRLLGPEAAGIVVEVTDE